MNLTNIDINGLVKPISDNEISSVSRASGLRFPTGYSDYMAELGEGELETESAMLRIYSPNTIVEDVEKWRSELLEGWFFDNSESSLDAESAMDYFILGESEYGDSFLFHPDSPDKIVILLRESTQPTEVRGGLAGLFDWYATHFDKPRTGAWTFYPY